VNSLAIGYATAFGAGFASFISPCVLPLVPAYLSFLAGVSYESAVEPRAHAAVRRKMLVAAVAFVCGFVAIFVAFGASATLVGKVLADYGTLLARISGLLLIALGLVQAGVVRFGAMQRELRFHPRALPVGPGGAFVMGLAFAFGWTPCVGPILAGILTLAASEHSVVHGIVLLALYGAGIGVPFLVAAVALAPFTRFMSYWRGRTRVIEASVGALMVATGALILTGSIADVGAWLLRTFPALSQTG
jgi:cytochrome c-type biogenesis protein